MRISAVHYVEKPRRVGQHWRVVVMNGALVDHHGFYSEDDAQDFHDKLTEVSNDD